MRPIQLGRLTIHKIFEMDSGVPMLAALPGVTGADLARMKRWHDDPAEFGIDPASSQMIFGVHSWLVQVDGLNILIDTCDGNHKTRSLEAVHDLDTRYLDGFARVGVAPGQIDLVLCTHLHFDHVGWNTQLENGRWVPTFPNARYLFSRRDYEHFRDEEPEGVHAEAFRDSVLPVVEAGLADIVEADIAVHREIADGVWLEPAFGHSPGSCTVHAQRRGSEALFWGDVIHHPVQLVRPDLPFFFDMDPALASVNRNRILARAADSDTLCFPAHFRGTSAGHVRRDGDAYRYEFTPG
jgi:glyoxylase-like metal-dependent hydrolase (beta-lactamase superfamily II)